MGHTTQEPTIQIDGYKIERVIGRGGMATVYLAVQESLNRHVALKVMNPALTTDESFKKRFLNEAHIIAQFNHYNIVTVFDFGAHEQYYYLCMAYLPGGTLKDKIRQGLPLKHKLQIIRELASALAYAHQRGVVHRDIKPNNVLFNESGASVLTDFGIAKVAGTATQATAPGFTPGSVGYMSPEQLMGKPVDKRTDLYSLGIVFWEMLTGETPYHADEVFALAFKHVTEPIPVLPPDLAVFQPILNKLLAKNPEERFADANEVIAALNAPTVLSAADRADKSDVTVLQTPPTIRLKTSAGEMPAKAHGSSAARFGLAIGILLAVLAAASIYFVPSWLPWPLGRNNSEQQREEPARRQAEQAQRQTELARQTEQEPQATVIKLLTQAQRQWQTGKITEPAGDNAFESYRQVLKLEPDNSEAKTKLIEIGRLRLGMQYHQTAERLLQAGALEDSLAEVEAGLRLAPGDAALLALKKTIQARLARETEGTYQRHQIDLLLAKARRQWQAGKITEPASDNAFESYRQVLKLEPDNSEAKTKLIEIGRIQLGIQYQREAERLLRENALQESLAKIEAGLRLAPDFPALLQLRQQVQARLKQR
jgi:serine/threonine-protein kinase PpkA